MAQYNFKNPAVKRLMREAQELKDPTEQYSAHPLEDNLFEWHFSFRGPADTDFEGGIYHGRIILPPEYPMKPPSILILTPNGRFELHKKICLSISGYHPESWQPSWSIRTAILAIIGFMPTKGEGAIGALEYTPEERRALARKSGTWSCPTCGPIKQTLEEPGHRLSEKSESEKRDEQLAKQINFSNPKPAQSKDSSSDKDATENSSTANDQPTETSPSQDGVRQRAVAPSPPSPSAQTQQQPARPQPAPAQRRNDDTTPFMLIIILSVVIAILILRRLDRAYDLRSNLPDLF